VNIEPYLPAITALFTLINTLVLAWNHRQVRKLRSKVNGMYLQTLADAEQRGRENAMLREAVRPVEPAARSAQSHTERQA
jgi:hypothetical protein